jgi:hypothetical protein
MMSPTVKAKICVVDYYLDGLYHHWEEIKGENFPVVGSQQTWQTSQGQSQSVRVVEIHPQSEVEYHVMLASETG